MIGAKFTMLSLPFTKMHGLGNDFVLFEDLSYPLSVADLQQIADRRFGIGCDQILAIRKNEAGLRTLRIWNADGTEAQACGNGTRCAIGFIALKHDLPIYTPLTLLGPTGLLTGWMTTPNEVTVIQGIPKFLTSTPLDLSSWNLPEGWAVSIGNPHLVIFVKDLDKIPVTTSGPLLEHHPFFPHKTNVEYVQITPQGLRMRVWERGVGETMACGTGASAAAFVALSHRYFTGSEIPVTLKGGTLFISWTEGSPLTQRGPFENVFEGIWPLTPSRFAI